MRRNNFFDVRRLTVAAIMAATACILGPVSVTLPVSLVPISACTLVFYLFAYLLRARESVTALIVYLIIGIAGLPVFSSYRSGIAVLSGPTGGYLLGYFTLCIIPPVIINRFPNNRILHIAAMVAATAILYVVGSIWLGIYTKMGFKAAIAAGSLPYLPGDGIKIAIAVLVGPVLRKRIVKSNHEMIVK